MLGVSAMSASANAHRFLSPQQFQWSVMALACSSLPAITWLDWRVSVVLIGVLAVRAWSARRYPQAWPAWLRVLMVLALLLLVVRVYGGIFGRGPGGALLLSMLALKSTESASTRDARVMVSISLFVLIASFLMTQSLVAMALSFFAAVICFAALEVLTRPSVGGPTASPISRLVGKDVLLLLSLAVPLTVALWLLVPRLNAPLWGTDEGNNGRSGFSNSMRPNEILEMLIDESPAMRVRFENGARPNPNSLYFRGPIMWNYSADGAWSSSDIQRSPFGPRNLPSPEDIRYEVILEPNDQRALFVADRPVSVSEPSVIFSSEQRFFRPTPVSDILRYTATSRLADSVPQGRYPRQERAWALGLPDARNPRTLALGRQLAERFENPRDLVAEVLTMYREQPFRYTLEAPEPLGIHTVDEFVFDQRAGFCQHFASSFAVIMRAAGIPTRVVTGFAGGEYRNAGYLLVTNARAHAWNEVLIDDQWLRVDPTAQIPQERVDPAARDALGENRSDLVRAWQEWRDQMADWWNRTVLNFNAKRQSQLFNNLGIPDASWEVLIGILASVIAVFSIIWMLLFKWKDRTVRHPVTAAYFRVLTRLARKTGMIRADAEGAQDFLSRVKSEHAQASWFSAFESLSTQFIHLNYAGELSALSPQEIRAFQQSAAAATNALNTGQGAH